MPDVLRHAPTIAGNTPPAEMFNSLDGVQRHDALVRSEQQLTGQAIEMRRAGAAEESVEEVLSRATALGKEALGRATAEGLYDDGRFGRPAGELTRRRRGEERELRTEAHKAETTGRDRVARKLEEHGVTGGALDSQMDKYDRHIASTVRAADRVTEKYR